MLVDIKNMVSVTDVSQSASRYVTAAEAGETYVVMRRNQPAAVLTSPDRAARLDRVEEMEDDLRLLTVALVRMSPTAGNDTDLKTSPPSLASTWTARTDRGKYGERSADGRGQGGHPRPRWRSAKARPTWTQEA